MFSQSAAKKEKNKITHKETIDRNIGLTFDFVNYLIDTKEELSKLPESFKLEFIEKDFPKIEHKQAPSNSTPVLNDKYVSVKNSFDVAM
jgi:hypothetical protein